MKRIVKQLCAQYPKNGYLLYHAKRYDKVLDILDEQYQEGMNILDVGKSHLTDLISRYLNTAVDTLGFGQDRKTTLGQHYEYDLNDTQLSASWRRDIGNYDIIIFCEVIEHLYTSPRFVLSYLRKLLNPGGCVVLQTPNAVVLHKRLLFLAGRNPFNRIGDDRKNPSHFREYTKKELVGYAKEVGFFVEVSSYENYFDYRYVHHHAGNMEKTPLLAIFSYFYLLMPGSLKPGMSFVLRKRNE